MTPRSRDGMIESYGFSMACRKTAVSARRPGPLQMIHNTIVCGSRRSSRSTAQPYPHAARPHPWPRGYSDLTAYRDLESAYRIGLKSLARRYLELCDEIADLDVRIAAIVDELRRTLWARNSIGHIGAAQLLSTAGDNPERLRSEASFGVSRCAASALFRRPRERPSGIASTEAEIAQPTARCISSPSDAYGPTREPRTMLLVG